MTISVLRTADAWWVQTPTGAAKIETAASTTGELLADRAAIDAAAHSHTTVAIDTIGMGEAAARLLVERSADVGRPRRQVVLQPKLIVRASSAATGATEIVDNVAALWPGRRDMPRDASPR